MPLSQQKFGIEIECYNVNYEILAHVANTWRGWSHHGDGSIHATRLLPGRFSAEIVSPPLPATDDSFRQVKEVMKYLRENGVKVNKSCGQHIHVDVETDVNSGEVIPGLLFRNLFERYQALENQLDFLVPRSRRGNSNSYCHSVNVISPYDRSNLNRIFALTGIPNDSDFDTICSVSRGYKINVSAYERHGTVEIRHGGATLNGTKAVSWIRFCLAFVKYAKLISLTDVNARREVISDEYNNIFTMLNSPRHVAYLQARIESMRNPQPRVATPATSSAPVEAAGVADEEEDDRDPGPSFPDEPVFDDHLDTFY